MSFGSKAASAQDKSLIFNKLRQLPDLGACPNNASSADPHLKKALTSALTQVRAEVKDLVNSVASMKDAGLLSPDELKQFSDSSDKLDKVFKKTGQPNKNAPQAPADK
jgi:hypothetical protein